MKFDKSISLNTQVCKVEIVSVQDVQTISDGPTIVSKTVTLKTGKTWTEIYNTAGQSNFSQELMTDFAGYFYQQQLSILHPGVDQTVMINLSYMQFKLWLIRITYNSGLKILAGTISNPVELTKCNFSTEKSGWEMEFTRKSPDPVFQTS